MKLYEPKVFTLPIIEGLSEKQLEIHMNLYKGYVKHVNLIQEQIKELKETNEHQYVIDELRRRFAFEFDGMRLHEYYFEQLVGGATTAPEKLVALMSKKYESFDAFLTHIKEVAGSRGIGWVLVNYDDVAGHIHTSFVADHELGNLAGTRIILAIDLWEHAFMVDYVPAQKGAYVQTILDTINWEVVAKRL